MAFIWNGFLLCGAVVKRPMSTSGTAKWSRGASRSFLRGRKPFACSPVCTKGDFYSARAFGGTETAKGVMSVSLEDETGNVQVIVWPIVKARPREPLLRSRLLAVKGTWQRDEDVRNPIAAHVEDLTRRWVGSRLGARIFT